MCPFVLTYMGTGYLLWRYQILYVSVRCYESGGRMWPVYCSCICWWVALCYCLKLCGARGESGRGAIEGAGQLKARVGEGAGC